MTRDEFISCVAGDVDRIAQDALVVWRGQGRLEDSPAQLVCDVADALASNPILSKRTQAQRLGTLLRGLRLRKDQLSPVAQMARAFPAHLRVTVANAIPPDARLEVYGSQVRTAAPDAESRTGEARPPSAEPEPRGREGSEPGEEQLAYSTVLLLSHPDHQDANRRLLGDAGLDPLVVETSGQLEKVLATSTDVCGCAIDQSALALLDATAQSSLFETLAAYSSFIAIRVHEAPELLISRDSASKIIKTVRRLGTPVPHDAISFQADGTIREAELPFYQNAARLLQSHEAASFVLGELTAAEAHLLVAAARTRVWGEGLDPELDSRPLTVRFLAGGLSGARLATVMCGATPTFVAKITSKELALDEMLRFRTFVQRWNDELRPECHFHGTAAVILFGLVRGDEDPSRPAEPLQKRLHDLWDRQWMQSQPETVADDARFVSKALSRVAQTLAELNRQTPPLGINLLSFVNPPATHLDALDHEGFVWGLGECALAARKAAADRVRRMARSAVVHGDIHLRNVLIRGESEVHLIDFAASGPGHPAVDLVRLELALYLGPVRQFEDGAASVAFQRALSVDWLTLDILRERFPDFFRFYVNAACAAGMTAARDAALEVLRSHGGDSRDYLAAKLLIAWQSLAIIGAQTGLARAVIAAVAEEIATW
ncbi:MAG: phosphotransferase [Gemmatimonadales bacterium]